MTSATFNRLHDSEGVPSVTRLMAYKIGMMLDRQGMANRVRSRMQGIVRLILHLAGFACLTIAGFTWNPVAGFVVAGLSCFAFSALSTSGQSEPDGQPDSTRR